MALRLKSNPAPRSGALFVSNPRKRKPARKNRAVKKLRVVRKRKNVAKKRKNPVRKNIAKKRVTRKNIAKKRVRKNIAKKRVVRKNIAKKRVVKKRKNPVRKRRVMRKNRKNPIKRKVRKNVMRKRKNGTKKGMVRKTARRAFMKKRKNPVKKTRIIRKNPMELSFLKPVEKLVRKIPLIGKKVAPFTQPAIVAMAGGASVMGAMQGLQYIGNSQFAEYARKPFGHAFGFTVMGLSLAVVSAFLPVKPATKKALAIACAGAGGAINASQLVMCGFDLQVCADQNKNLIGDGSVLNTDAEVLGDGMYYEIQPLSGIAIDDMSGIAIDSMAGIDYDNAQYGDAQACPADLSPIEGEMAVRGRDAYLKRFGTAPKRMAGQKRRMSIMAGKLGHRWGWLIKSLGYQRFSQLAQLPPAQRKKLIAQLKASAIQASQATFDRELTGGLQGLAYSDMSGLAIDMSGLAIDNMAGIAIAGAGI